MYVLHTHTHKALSFVNQLYMYICMLPHAHVHFFSVIHTIRTHYDIFLNTNCDRIS